MFFSFKSKHVLSLRMLHMSLDCFKYRGTEGSRNVSSTVLGQIQSSGAPDARGNSIVLQHLQTSRGLRGAETHHQQSFDRFNRWLHLRAEETHHQHSLDRFNQRGNLMVEETVSTVLQQVQSSRGPRASRNVLSTVLGQI